MAEKIFCEEMIKPELSEDTLAHYGVLGMKWGVREDLPAPDFYNEYVAHSSGWTKKNHKYISRERGKNGKWQYTYTRKSKKRNKKIKISSFLNRFKKEAMSKIHALTDKIDKDHDYILDIVDRNVTVSALKNDPRFAKKEQSKKEKYQNTSKTERSHKYYMKIKTSNGKYRYFYSEAEYNRYIQRINTLDKDYSFMQDVPVLSTKPQALETAKKTDVGTDAGNCSSCAIAFELRMRGYDVQSKSDVDGATRKEIASAFKGLESKASDNWYLDTTRKENRGYYMSGFFNQTSEEKQLQIAQDDLERTIKERGGDNQRGFIHIGWTRTDPDENGKRQSSGGGHIFNYVVENGQVKYYDAQKGESNNQMGGEIDIKTYLDNTDYIAHRPLSSGEYATYMSIERVDNKDISEISKNYIQYAPIEIHSTPEIETKQKIRNVRR